MGRSMADIAARSQRLVNDWLKRQAQEGVSLDPLNVGGAFLEMTAKLLANPTVLMEAQMGLWQDYMTLWQNTTRRMLGEAAEPVIQSDPKDKRFVDPAWQQNEVFDFIKQSYLLSARYINDVIGKVDGLPPKTAQKIDFYARQFINALSPSNFLLTNPEVLRRTRESGGENLVRGLNNLLNDLEQGRGNLRIKMTDTEAFKVGGNIAISDGQVVFQNELMQLIQYAPTTATVQARPLVIFPPWINKFYILDLRPKNSLVRYLVSQGHTVFMVSWVNPDASLALKNFDDYMVEGVFAALDAIEKATQTREVNAIGYCLGGTLLAATLGYMKARGDDRIKSATFFVTLTDFSDAGELGVFIDEEQLSSAGRAHAAPRLSRGRRDGDHLQHAARQRPDLVLRGEQLPARQGTVPLRPAVLELRRDAHAAGHALLLSAQHVPEEPALPAGRPVDEGRADRPAKIDIPVYFLSCREDHIAPWTSTYRGALLFGGKVRFVLAASGHIAGVVNPPEGGKYNHFINDALPDTADAWFEGATEVSGSWWPDWQHWVSRLDHSTVPARIPGEGLQAIEPAPGSYVMVRA